MQRRVEDPQGVRPFGRALRVALVYLAVGLVWILASDRILRAWVSDPTLLTSLQTLKGWVFVILSAGLLWALVRHEMRGLEAGERRFRALVEQSLAGVGVIQDGRIVYANPKLGQILGRSVSELVGMSRPEKMVVGGLGPEVREAFSSHMKDEPGGPRRSIRVLTGDGLEHPVEVALQDVEWHGRPAKIALVLDRSEEEMLEQQLRHAQRMEAIGRLTGAIAHDFNNLLTAIHGPLELAMADLGRDHPAHADLKEAFDAARRATGLTRQLLTFSRKRVSQPRAVDLNEALHDLRPMIERLAGTDVSVSLELGTIEGRVLIEPAQLEQVVVNLVVNAREAMPGGGALRIRTRLVASDPTKLRHRGGLNPGAHAVLEVADTGHGMDPDTRTHAFEPFFTTREKGTGLGLSTVFGVVRQADGFIRVQSELGQGTTMQVHLPLSDAPAEAAGEVQRAAEGAPGAAREQGAAGEPIPAYGPLDDPRAAGADDPERRTVLVADDEESVRRLFNRVLGRAGYRVLSAGDGPSALGLADTHGEDIDLLITDVSLPGMSGLALGTEFERRHPKVPILYMSGYSEEDLIEQLRTRRGIAFLEKPFQIDELLGAVQGAMGGERRAS